MSLPVAILTPETAGSVGPMRFYLLSGTRLKEISARIGRTKTLDGGVHYDHRGLTDGDRTIQLRTRITRTQTESIRGLMALGERFYLAVKEAVWVGHIAKIDDTFGDATLEFWPHSRLGDASTISYDVLTTVDYSVTISAADTVSINFGGDVQESAIILGTGYKTAVRWVSSIPNGAVITSATASFTSSMALTTPFTVSIHFEASDDAATMPPSYNDFPVNENLTSETVNWSVSAWTSSGTYTTVDFTAVLQEVINRAGYVSGNSVQMILSSGSSAYRFATTTVPLSVDYTA